MDIASTPKNKENQIRFLQITLHLLVIESCCCGTCRVRVMSFQFHLYWKNGWVEIIESWYFFNWPVKVIKLINELRQSKLFSVIGKSEAAFLSYHFFIICYNEEIWLIGKRATKKYINCKMVGVSYLRIQVKLKGFLLLSVVSNNEEP